jgi:hypothetical protein
MRVTVRDNAGNVTQGNPTRLAVTSARIGRHSRRVRSGRVKVPFGRPARLRGRLTLPGGHAFAGQTIVATAAVRRHGADVTVLAYGTMVYVAEAAAAETGVDAEIIDLRTLLPLDLETITASVRKTGRCVVVTEAPGFAGVGAEITARVQERCFHSLHAPVLRVTGFDIPYPPPKLEQHHLPSVDRILDAIARLQWDDQPEVGRA